MTTHRLANDIIFLEKHSRVISTSRTIASLASCSLPWPSAKISHNTKITSLETRDSGLSQSEDFMILSCVVLTQYSSVTDMHTDGQTEGRLCRSKGAL